MVWEALNRAAEMKQAGPGLDEEIRRQIAALAELYPNPRAVLLPVLHLVQAKYRQISDEAIAEIAAALWLSPAEVGDTVSFFEMYSRKQMGEHLIAVCESIACELCGCDALLEALHAKLGIRPGQTTPDGRFSLLAMQCLGLCDFAPAIQIDWKVYKNVKVEELDTILAEYTKS